MNDPRNIQRHVNGVQSDSNCVDILRDHDPGLESGLAVGAIFAVIGMLSSIGMSGSADRIDVDDAIGPGSGGPFWCTCVSASGYGQFAPSHPAIPTESKCHQSMR